MGGCDSCIKYLLFAFNLIFSLAGIALIVVGSILLANISDIDTIISDIGSGLTAPQITIIVVGVVIFLVATLGCCGAIKENRCMLITFAVLLLVVFIVQLAIGIYALVNFSDLKDRITEVLRQHFDEINTNPDTQKVFESMEKALHCCGLNNYHDYPSGNVPDSCCRVVTEGCGHSSIGGLNFWDRGCVDELTDFTTDAGKILGGVAIGLSVVEIIGAIFALRLASQSK